MTSEARNEGSLRRFVRRGRLLTVAGTKWRWRVGRGGNVIAYSEHGERRCAGAWTIRGMDQDTFDRGQWKRTSDGMVRPADIAKWLLAPNAPLERAERSDDTLGGVVGNFSESVAREKWNAEADEYNQWDSLGQDEKDELIANAEGQPRREAT